MRLRPKRTYSLNKDDTMRIEAFPDTVRQVTWENSQRNIYLCGLARTVNKGSDGADQRLANIIDRLDFRAELTQLKQELQLERETRTR